MHGRLPLLLLRFLVNVIMGSWYYLYLYYWYHPDVIKFLYKRNLKGAKLIMGELRRVLAGNRSVQHPAIGA